MRSKKILFVADASSVHIAKWVNYFVDRRYDVHLATFSSVNRTKCKNIYFLSKKKVKVTGGNYHYLLGIVKLAKIMQKLKPDIVNAHYSYSMGLISFLAIKKSNITTNFSIVCHGSDLLAPPKPIVFNTINKYLLKRCDKIFAVSDQIKDKISSFSIDLDRVFVGQYGVDINNQESKKDIDILSNRSYMPNSRIEFLLDSLKDFEHDGLNIVFILPHVSKKIFEKLKTKYSFITFYEYMSYESMIKMVARSKIYISATKSDGTSLSLLEAMHLGAIPVVSNIVSNRSWVLDSVNGYLFDTKEQFVESIRKSLKVNSNKAVNINRALIKDKCNYKNQMQKIEKFLNR